MEVKRAKSKPMSDCASVSWDSPVSRQCRGCDVQAPIVEASVKSAIVCRLRALVETAVDDEGFYRDPDAARP